MRTQKYTYVPLEELDAGVAEGYWVSYMGIRIAQVIRGRLFPVWALYSLVHIEDAAFAYMYGMKRDAENWPRKEGETIHGERKGLNVFGNVRTVYSQTWSGTYEFAQLKPEIEKIFLLEDLDFCLRCEYEDSDDPGVSESEPDDEVDMQPRSGGKRRKGRRLRARTEGERG